jgi:hypothetical protein
MAQAVHSRGAISGTAEFLGALRGFLRTPIGPDECRNRLRAGLAQREAGVLRLFRELMNAESPMPYRRLFDHAGLTMGDLDALVRSEGACGALARIHDAGVFVTLDEFKGRRPIQRGSLSLAVEASDFDNRTVASGFLARTGGSRSAGRPLLIDLDLVAHEACYEWMAGAAFERVGALRALWRPVPPGTAGLKHALRFAKIGQPVERWFSQHPVWAGREWRHSLFTAGTILASHIAGRGLAWPEHVPASEAATIARWMAQEKARGRPPVLHTNSASGVRVCQASRAAGLDISGSFFRVGGEPYTEAKAAAIAGAGCLAASIYSMSEVGRIATPCADPAAPDDAHVAIDKVVLLSRDTRVGGAASPVPALFLTALHRSTPKVMLNVELGDYATVTNRVCRCPWSALGFTVHVSGIRSYEKLTAEGMHFVGAHLLTLIEHTLPATFGGSAVDYQLVEDEREGVPVVSLVVSPAIGDLDESRLREHVLAELGHDEAALRMMAARWRDAGTLRVERRDPFVTPAGKVLALHVHQRASRDA